MTLNDHPQRARVLALDLGTCTGWALREREGMRVTGHNDFVNKRGDGAGMRLIYLKRFLTDAKGTDGLDMVVYEQVEFASTTYAAQLYGQFLGILLAWCEHHRIPYAGVKVQVLKRHGTGKGGGKGADKTAMIAAAARLGVVTDDHNEADAVVLLDYAEQNLVEREHESSTAAEQDAARPGRA